MTRVQRITERDLEIGDRPAVVMLVPLPSPEEREARILKSLDGAPGLEAVSRRLSRGGTEGAITRPFWVSRASGQLGDHISEECRI